MDWILQKAVELGVSKITPLLTRFCNIKLTHERMEKRLAHWQKIIYSACEQTGRSTLPLLEPISLFPEWIKTQSAQLMVYCDPTAPQGISALPESREVLVLIGPEGGLSQQEIIEAQEQNFIGISLGPRILRTETAALVAISLFQCQWGDINPSTQV
jgi:16S rRNA (uracil1498-N3)-methyltransferase